MAEGSFEGQIEGKDDVEDVRGDRVVREREVTWRFGVLKTKEKNQEDKHRISTLDPSAYFQKVTGVSLRTEETNHEGHGRVLC